MRKIGLLIFGALATLPLKASESEILEVIAANPGNRTFDTEVFLDSDELSFSTTLKGSYCGDCQTTLEQDVSCQSKFSIPTFSLRTQLLAFGEGDTIEERLRIKAVSELAETDTNTSGKVYKIGFEDIPVELFDKGPACRLPYIDYDDLFLTVAVYEKKKPGPAKPIVELAINDWFGNPLDSDGDNITEAPRCGSTRSKTYQASLVGTGEQVFDASQGIKWKIYHDRDEPITYAHYDDDPESWENTATTGHFLLKTSENQDQPYMLDCEGHRSCFLALPCMYGGRGILVVEAQLADGTTLKKRFSAKNGRWENRRF